VNYVVTTDRRVSRTVTVLALMVVSMTIVVAACHSGIGGASDAGSTSQYVIGCLIHGPQWSVSAENRSTTAHDYKIALQFETKGQVVHNETVYVDDVSPGHLGAYGLAIGSGVPGADSSCRVKSVDVRAASISPP
jgi:hypothetical protein